MSAPPPARLAWVERALGGRVVRARRLSGGISSEAHDLLVDRGGRPRHVVLRAFAHRDPRDPSLARELAILEALGATAVPAPVVLVADVDGAEAGVPAMLMERLPGRIELRPERVVDHAGQVGRMLADIHRLGIDAPISVVRATELGPVDGMDGAPAWAEVSARLDLGAPPPSQVTFVHGDYQHYNLLWSAGQLRAVVDWSLAGTGVPDRDLAHCRWNLATLHAPEVAEEVRAVWEAEMGRPQDPWWDVVHLAMHRTDSSRFLRKQVGRRLAVDWTAVDGRVDALLRRSLARLG